MADNPSIEEAEYLAEEQYDASDQEQVNKARQKVGREKKAHLNFVHNILQTPDGRKWYYRLLAECETLRISYMRGENEKDSGFREGKRFIGFQLMADAKKADPKMFFKMLEECEQLKLPPLFPQDGLL